MLILIAIIYFGIKFIGEAIDDAEMRAWSKQRGMDTYSSKTGLRDVKTGKRCHINPLTGEKTLWW